MSSPQTKKAPPPHRGEANQRKGKTRQQAQAQDARPY